MGAGVCSEHLQITVEKRVVLKWVTNVLIHLQGIKAMYPRPVAPSTLGSGTMITREPHMDPSEKTGQTH